MSIVIWLVFGLVVGVCAFILDPDPVDGGLLGAVLLGIVGALVGGFLGGLLFSGGLPGFNFASLSVAVLGSLLLLFISRIVMKT